MFCMAYYDELKILRFLKDDLLNILFHTFSINSRIAIRFQYRASILYVLSFLDNDFLCFF